VRLQLTVDGDADETERLRQFLVQDVDVQRAGDLRYGRPKEPGHLGVDIQVLSLAIGSTLTSIGLGIQLVNFRRSRLPRRPVITITSESADGTVVRIDSDDPDAVAEMIRKLENG
jgi:hypothetical protein